MQALAAAANGLLYPSETDASLEAFAWDVPGPATAELVLRCGKHDGAPVKESTVEAFFNRVTRIQEWHGEEERANVQRFQELERVVRESLCDVRVFEVGEIEVTVYVVGTTPDNTLAGLRTLVVRT